MDFEKCWAALATKANDKGMDITSPDTKVEFSTENLKTLLEQFHAQGVAHGRSREKAIQAAHSTVNNLFDQIFGGRR